MSSHEHLQTKEIKPRPCRKVPAPANAIETTLPCFDFLLAAICPFRDCAPAPRLRSGAAVDLPTAGKWLISRRGTSSNRSLLTHDKNSDAAADHTDHEPGFDAVPSHNIPHPMTSSRSQQRFSRQIEWSPDVKMPGPDAFDNTVTPRLKTTSIETLLHLAGSIKLPRLAVLQT